MAQSMDPTNTTNNIITKTKFICSTCPNKYLCMTDITGITTFNHNNLQNLLIILNVENNLTFFDMSTKKIIATYKPSVEASKVISENNIAEDKYQYHVTKGGTILMRLIVNVDTQTIFSEYFTYFCTEKKIHNLPNVTNCSKVYCLPVDNISSPDYYIYTTEQDIYIRHKKYMLSLKPLENRKLVCFCKKLKGNIIMKNLDTKEYEIYNITDNKIIHTFESSVSINDDTYLEISDNWVLLKQMVLQPEVPIGMGCTICFEAIKQRVALIPCGHSSFCSKCVEKVDACPLCKIKYTNVQKIFI